MIVATPNTVDCTIPQEFQGMSTEVTVDESTNDRLSSRPSKPNFSYTPLNNRLERMIEMYWSEVVVLNNTPAPTVAATADVVRFTKRKNSCVSESSMRLPVITPPKHMAQSMSQIVSIIPPMPRVAISSFTAGTPVSKLADP